MVEVKSTELLEYAKYILKPIVVTNHFHVTVNQGLFTRFLRRSSQDALYLRFKTFVKIIR